MSTLIHVTSAPALITAAGDRASYRFLDFLTAQIRHLHTRRAYMPSIAAVGSIHVAACIEDLGHQHSAPTVKQHLAAIQCVLGSAGIVGAR